MKRATVQSELTVTQTAGNGSSLRVHSIATAVQMTTNSRYALHRRKDAFVGAHNKKLNKGKGKGTVNGSIPIKIYSWILSHLLSNVVAHTNVR